VSSCRKCQKKFTRLRRRHHCRLCGAIFCSACSRWRTNIEGFKKKHRRVNRRSHCALAMSRSGTFPVFRSLIHRRRVRRHLRTSLKSMTFGVKDLWSPCTILHDLTMRALALATTMQILQILCYSTFRYTSLETAVNSVSDSFFAEVTWHTVSLGLCSSIAGFV